MDAKMYSIKQAAQRTGLSEFYIRKCLRDHKVPGAQKELIAGTEIPKWLIPSSWVESKIDPDRKRPVARTDGRHKFVLYSKDDNELAEFGLTPAMIESLREKGLLKKANVSSKHSDK